MASGAAAGASGGALLLLTKPGSINIGAQPLFPFKTPNFNFYYSPRSRRSYVSTINSRWNSNAETVKSQIFKFKFRDKDKRYRDNDVAVDEEEEEEESGGVGKGKKRRWWSDEPRFMEEEEAPSILEEFIDSLWILKLSKFYGWTLPPIIISFLIANGLKAFLMALALPVGLSVVSFVFQKLSGRTRSKPRPRRRARKRRKQPFVSYPSDVGRVDKEEGRQETIEGNGVPRTRVVNDDGSVKNEKKEAASSFGGWDELGGMEPVRRRTPRKAAQNRRKPSMNGKLGKRRVESDAPLLLRLLIAVFPFLASWTKML
ncbi:uncharacterized protein [Euphorbia lathyris]|uniref:uncharacterized protein n=1 Tax=Euphorbia lathyris TaxID=212925 RepID=UPI0033143953